MENIYFCSNRMKLKKLWRGQRSCAQYAWVSSGLSQNFYNDKFCLTSVSLLEFGIVVSPLIFTLGPHSLCWSYKSSNECGKKDEICLSMPVYVSI